MRSVCWAVVFCCLSSVVASPRPGASQLVEDLVNIHFQADVRIFAVMSALNVMGLDLDADELGPNPARRLVRDRLTGISQDLRTRLRQFRESRATQQTQVDLESDYLSYALVLGDPPQFDLACQADEVPPEARPAIGFESLLAELWREGDLERLWGEVRPLYVQEIALYRPLIRDMIVGTLRYLRTEPRVALDRQVTFIPELLGGYGIVNARNFSRQYIVVVGPSRAAERPMRSLRHEYLHFLVDPLLSKNAAHLPEAGPFLRRMQEQPAALARYRRNFYLTVAESFIQMTELKLDALPAEDQTAVVVGAYDQGLILAPYFETVLRGFARRSESLPELFQSFLDGISWDTESGRAAVMDRLRGEVMARKAEQERKQAAEAVQARARAEIRSMLESANESFRARDFPKAKEALERVLALDQHNAGALFGLAQVAAQDEAWDHALELYAQAALHAGEAAWIAGWSFVRRGNIYSMHGDQVRAREEWSKVDGLGGDLRGASEAAKKALAGEQP